MSPRVPPAKSVQERKPPPKRAGVPSGPRRLNGEVWDIHTLAAKMGASEKMVRGQVARKLLPHRKLGARIVFLPDEIRSYLAGLPGVSVDEALLNTTARSER